MGKAAVFTVLAVMIASNVLLYESLQTSVATDKVQSDRQGQVLAREIARSGHNVALSKARQLQREYPLTPLEDIIEMVNGDQGYITGDLQGGEYSAQVYLTSASSFAVKSVGLYTVDEMVQGEHEERSQKKDTVAVTVLTEDILGEEVLEVTEPSTLQIEFLESMAGYCSAIFLQRMLPLGNGEYDPQEPELVFAPGNNRDGAEANYETVLQPGTLMNFILAVDADFNCEKRNDNSVTIDDNMFEYTRPALQEDIEDLGEMEEGMYAMIQENPYEPGVWRIAFEDLVFGNAKLSDTKQNGYGGNKWKKKKKTYGGNGWTDTDSRGYWRLRDYGGKPDFSDQVIEIRMVAPEAL